MIGDIVEIPLKGRIPGGEGIEFMGISWDKRQKVIAFGKVAFDLEDSKIKQESRFTFGSGFVPEDIDRMGLSEPQRKFLAEAAKKIDAFVRERFQTERELREEAYRILVSGRKAFKQFIGCKDFYKKLDAARKKYSL